MSQKVLHVINELGMGGAEMLLIKALPKYDNKLITVDLLVLLERPNCPYTSDLRRKGVNIITLGSNGFKNPVLIFKLIPYLRKYDIIHVHLFPSLYWVALAKMVSFSSTTLVFTEHSTNNRRINSSLYSVFDFFIYKYYSKIVTISKDVDIAIKKHLGFKNSRFHMIENGVDLQEIYDGVAYNKEDYFNFKDCKIILQVSSFKDPKDQDTLIKSLKLLPENFCLILVGEGIRKDECELLVNNLELKHRVLFLGNRNDIPKLLKTADIVVLSSRYEGLSLASIEGMASGKPFVASDAPGLSDIVEGAGILFPIGNEKKLAEIIQSLDSDSELYRSTVENCLIRAKKFDINRMIDQHIDLYKELN